MDAKLDTIETRLDGRVASIEATIRGFMERMDERFRHNDERMDERLKHSDERMDRLEESMMETRTDIANLRTTVIVTAISVGLAVVFGIAAFNATVLSTMLAAFESGRSVSTAQAEAARRNEEAAAMIKQLQQQRAPTPPPK